MFSFIRLCSLQIPKLAYLYLGLSLGLSCMECSSLLVPRIHELSISSITTQEGLDPTKPIRLIIKGREFDQGAKVEISINRQFDTIIHLTPGDVKRELIRVIVDPSWIPIESRKVHANMVFGLLQAPPINFLSVRVVNRGQRISNSLDLKVNYPIVETEGIESVLLSWEKREPENTKDSIMLTAIPGSRRELRINIKRRNWMGEIPLEILAFKMPAGVRKTSPNNVFAVNEKEIYGMATIPPGESQVQIPIQIRSSILPGNYLLQVRVAFERLYIKEWAKTEGIIFPATSKLESVQDVVTQIFESRLRVPEADLETSTISGQKHPFEIPLIVYDTGQITVQPQQFPPAAPEIVAINRRVNDKIEIQFQDHSLFESGFKVLRKPQGDLANWEIVGQMEGRQGSWQNVPMVFLDGNHNDQQYFYKIRAWNAAGMSDSPIRCGNPPKLFAENPMLIHFSQDEMKGNLLCWTKLNSEQHTIKVLRKLPNGIWIVISSSSSELHHFEQPDVTGVFDHDNKRGKKSYRILIGNEECGYAVTEFNLKFDERAPSSPSKLLQRKRPSVNMISWEDNSLNEEGFRIYLWKESTKKWKLRSQLPSRPGEGLVAYSDQSGIQTGEPFAYIVTSFNRYGQTGVYGSNHLDLPLKLNFQCEEGFFLDPDGNPLEGNCCVWDWRQDNYEFYRSDGSSYRFPSPWNGVVVPSLSGRLADREPAFGWRLLKRNFGSNTTGGVTLPYFILYNKYLSKIKVFFLGPEADIIDIDPSSRFYISISDMPSGKSLAIKNNVDVSFASDFLGREKLELKQFHLIEAFANGVWAHADFEISYDPLVKLMENPKLQLWLSSQDDLTVELEGNISLSNAFDGTLTAKKSISLQEGFNVVSQIAEEFSVGSDKINNLYENNIKNLRETNSELPGSEKVLGTENLGSKSIELALKATSDIVLDNLGFFGAIGGLFGNVFNAGGNGKVLTLSGELDLKGKIIWNRPRYPLSLRIPGTFFPEIPNQTEEPFLNYPLGIFTLKNTPVLIEEIEYDTNSAGSLTIVPKGTTSITNIEYEINPESNMRLRELYVSVLVYGGEKRKGSTLQFEKFEAPEELDSSIVDWIVDFNKDITSFPYGIKPRDEDKFKMFRTEFVPYDRFIGFRFKQPHPNWIDIGNNLLGAPFPAHIFGVRLLGILENTAKLDSLGEPSIYTFSRNYRAYSMTTQQALLQSQNKMPKEKINGFRHFWKNWQGEFSDETVGTAIKQYLSGEWFTVVKNDLEGDVHILEPYSHNNNRAIGNLVVNHDKVDRFHSGSVFRKSDLIQFGFVQYKKIDSIDFVIEKFDGASWTNTAEELTWRTKKYSSYVGPEMDYITKMLVFNPKNAKYWIANLQKRDIGSYRIKIRAYRGSKFESLTRDFEVIY